MQRDYPPIPDRYDVIRPVVMEPAQVPAEPWRPHHQDHLVPGGDDLFKLRPPLLLVTSAQDPYGSAQAASEFLAAAPGRDKRLVKVPGADHGTALLSGPAAATVLSAVLTFLRRALAGS